MLPRLAELVGEESGDIGLPEGSTEFAFSISEGEFFLMGEPIRRAESPSRRPSGSSIDDFCSSGSLGIENEFRT
jgi:hypothetical protein